jgi:hypothetical protein
MNKITLLLLPLFLLSIQCKKKDAEPNLPATTQTGANTFGCRVNGKVFISKGNVGTYALPLTANYSSQNTSTYNFSVSGSNLKRDDRPLITLGSAAITLVSGKTFPIQLTGNTTGVEGRYYDNNGGEYKVQPPLTGQLSITKIDLTAKIISGSFYFDAVNDKGEKVEIRDGRFDVKYPIL